jgi:hypothetical protein
MEDFNRLLQSEMGQLSRRLRGMAMISRGIVPNLVISQNVVDKVVRAAQGYLEDETGETMVGLVVDTNEPETMPTLYVLDTIAPDDSTIRRSHMFEQGDNIQRDIFLWLKDNWETYLEVGKDMNGRPIPDELHQPLQHLGDWHKQPGFMIQPSGGDLMTALRYMDDPETEFEYLLVPIVTLGHASVTSEDGAQVNYFNVLMENGTSLRMDWWYIHRDVRVFQPITPKVVPPDELPELPPYSWHILDVDLMDEELSLIEEDGMFMVAQTALPYPINNELPLEICFIIGRAGYTDVFIVTTHWDYPNTPPRVYKTPFTGIDPTMYIYQVFEQLWERAEQVEHPPDFEWNPESSYMVDLLAAVEKHLGMRPDDLPMPWERSNLSAADVGAESDAVAIAVEVESDGHNPGTASTDDTDDTDETDSNPDSSETVVASAAAANEASSDTGTEAVSDTDDAETDETETDDESNSGNTDETIAETETSEDKTP